MAECCLGRYLAAHQVFPSELPQKVGRRLADIFHVDALGDARKIEGRSNPRELPAPHFGILHSPTPLEKDSHNVNSINS